MTTPPMTMTRTATIASMMLVATPVRSPSCDSIFDSMTKDVLRSRFRAADTVGQRQSGPATVPLRSCFGLGERAGRPHDRSRSCFFTCLLGQEAGFLHQGAVG